jgi:hypothetical protein
MKRAVVDSQLSPDGTAIGKRAAAAPEEPRLIIRTCKHILESGACCRQPAVAGRKYCRAHLELRLRRRRMLRARRQHRGLKLPRLTSLEAVQDAHTRVAVALAFGHIDPETARVLRWSLMQSAAYQRFKARQEDLPKEP